jgi:hypothetical protein
LSNYFLERKGTYRGGGTWFEALGPNGSVVNAGIGQAVMFAGPLKHAGYPITSGIRNILVLFLYVEGFHYGPQLRDYISRHPSGRGIDTETEGRDRDDADRTNSENDCTDDLRSSGAAKGGFVVYRQTVELVSMLEETETETLTVTATEELSE